MVEPTGISYLPLLAKMFAPAFAHPGKAALSSAKEKWDRYTEDVDEYLKKMVTRHKYFSSVVFSNEGKYLEDYYIPLTLVQRNVKFFKNRTSHASDVFVTVKGYPDDLLSTHQKILVVDTAGMGKSTLFKFLFLKTVEAEKSIPIFVELRRLGPDLDLETLVLQDLGSDERVNKPFFKKCMENGAFTFYLDGFDEVSDEIKKSVSRSIVKLMERGPECKYLISSREEPSLTSLGQFQRFHIRPLLQNEAHSLIRRLITSAEVADSLIDKVQQASRELSEFLTNPLLVSLLVKSFLHSPILPVHLSEFYRQVFDALFQTHDAKKELGGYSREKRSGLNLDRFHKVLRALGVITYKLGKLEYSRDELLKEIERAKAKVADDSFSASDFLDDLLRAVPLFILEGQRFRWAHRSLQEYFAASFICIDAKEEQRPILMSICDSRTLTHNANLLRLCADMDSKTFQETIIKSYLVDLQAYEISAYKPKDFPSIPPTDLDARRRVAFDSAFFIYFMNGDDVKPEFKITDFEKLIGADIDFLLLLDSSLNTPEDSQSGQKKVGYAAIRSVACWGYTPLLIMRETYRQTLTDPMPMKRGKAKLTGLERGKLYPVNHSPKNPLNSAENFTIVTEFLTAFSHKVNFENCRDFLAHIERSLKQSEAFKISF